VPPTDQCADVGQEVVQRLLLLRNHHLRNHQPTLSTHPAAQNLQFKDLHRTQLSNEQAAGETTQRTIIGEIWKENLAEGKLSLSSCSADETV
jgi:hypothetical protein